MCGAQLMLDDADFLQNQVALENGPTWDSITDELSLLYRRAGLLELASFIK